MIDVGSAALSCGDMNAASIQYGSDTGDASVP